MTDKLSLVAYLRRQGGQCNAQQPIVPVAGSELLKAAAIIEAQQAEIERLRDELARQVGVNSGSWFYPDGDTSSDACCFCPSEVIDDHRTRAVAEVIKIERAAHLPPVFAAVRNWSESEKDERGDDDDYSYTLHMTEAEARAALNEGTGR